MSVRLEKTWRVLGEWQNIAGQLGVFELADNEGRVLYIGCAGGRSLRGLRSEIGSAAERIAGAALYRAEITSSYHTRWQELLMVHAADFGALPEGNHTLGDVPNRLGKLSPG